MREYWHKEELVWVAPNAVRYTAAHVKLLLPILPDMREGVYPPEPSGGYIGGKRTRSLTRAYYETVCQVAAEIDRRLACTGLDSYIVKDYYARIGKYGLPEENIHNRVIHDIAEEIDKEAWEISRRIKSAVSYIASGPCPRWLHCVDCKQYAECSQKKRVGCSYQEWVRSRSRQHRGG